MKNLRRSGAAAVLTVMLGLSVAGDTPTPPCAPPEPGQMPTPPCVTQMASNDPATPGEVESPLASNTVDMVSVVDAAMNLLLLF